MRILVFIAFVLAGLNVQAQNSQIGIGFGGTTYAGDLDAPNVFDKVGLTKGAFQINFSYFLNPNMNLRINALFGGLEGDDARSTKEWQLERNLSFESSLSEYSLAFEYNVFDIFSSRAKRRFTPYVTLGVGLFNFNPQATYLDPDGTSKTVELQPLGTEGQGIVGYAAPYSLTAVAIPFGGGIRYALSENLTISLELNSRYTFTDYIDDVSTLYPNRDDLLSKGDVGVISLYVSNQIDEALGLPQNDISVDRSGGVRGDDTSKDYYFSGMINIAYRLNGGLFSRGSGAMGCPSF